jgi:hypothetical protein
MADNAVYNLCKLPFCPTDALSDGGAVQLDRAAHSRSSSHGRLMGSLSAA